jgi:CYTH domain-containing protein
MVLAEVEFPTKEEALAFLPPDWFAEDVTANPAYQNSSLSKKSM